MDPIVGGALISGGFGLAGGMLSSSSSAKAATRAVKAQINWERERAQNAHQWEVQDLMKAGLNPILSAGGSGAVTGGISAPVPDTSGYASAGQAAADAVNSYVENKRKQAETALIGEQAANTRQDTFNKFAENGLILAQQDMIQAKLGLIPYETAKAKAEARLKEIEAELQKEFGKTKAVSEIVRNYAGAVGAVMGAGGLTAMGISKMSRAFNKVGGRPYGNYPGYNQGPWEGAYIGME